MIARRGDERGGLGPEAVNREPAFEEITQEAIRDGYENALFGKAE